MTQSPSWVPIHMAPRDHPWPWELKMIWTQVTRGDLPCPAPTVGCSEGISSPITTTGSLVLLKGGKRHSCMAARTSTSLSQGGQSAVLGLGLHQSPWHLAAFAGFRSCHDIKLWPVQFVSSTAVSQARHRSTLPRPGTSTLTLACHYTTRHLGLARMFCL